MPPDTGDSPANRFPVDAELADNRRDRQPATSPRLITAPLHLNRQSRDWGSEFAVGPQGAPANRSSGEFSNGIPGNKYSDITAKTTAFGQACRPPP